MSELSLSFPARIWVDAPADFRPVEYTSVYPQVQKMADGRLIVDQCKRRDGTWEVVIFDNRDDPAIDGLPEHCPRAVRQLFRRELRLRYLRSTDTSILADIDRARNAWASFVHTVAG